MVFALSLISILISVFSTMTLYQLYIHEKQKIYFSQLNSLRHRIHQRNVMQNEQSHNGKGHSDPQSIYMDHFNHLYPVDSLAAECGYLAQDKSLSMDFSSQDMLLDQSSTNFGVSNPKESPRDVPGRGRIWSSQSSSFVQSNEHRSGSAILMKAPRTACMRRYMSVIFDRSSNIQSYVRQKLNPFRRMHSLANERMDKGTYNKVNKSQLLPPHVTIPRYSMCQASVDSSNGNYSIDRTPVRYLRKSVSVQSTCSSHRSIASISCSSGKSKQAQSKVSESANQSKNLPTAQTETSAYNHPGCSSKKRSSEQTITSSALYKHESSSVDYMGQKSTDKGHNQQASSLKDCPIKIESCLLGQWPSTRAVINAARWSHSSMMDTFKCIDEDDFVNSDHLPLELEQRQKSHFSQASEVKLNMEGKWLHYQEESIGPNTSPEEVTSVTPCTSTKFTFGSQVENRRYATTFEEAFQKYSAISNQNCQYYTLPIKSSKERSKRKHNPSRPETNTKLRETFKVSGTENEPACANSMCTPSESGCLPMYCQPNNEQSANVKCEVNQTESHLIDEFPAIEPPADYKNVATTEEIAPMGNESKTKSMESLSNQLLQPYQYWVQQFIQQMNRTQQMLSTDTDKQLYKPTSMEEEYDTVADGFIEDDDEGAGDTSTSQDIADFELELDEEPVKFLDDDEYRTKLEANPLPQTNKLPVKTRVPQVGGQAIAHLNLLKQNTDLIRRAVQQNKANLDDYGFDGFRKGCFHEQGDSSTSTESSLSNGTDHGSEKSTNSITAEYIKPPTPFTNYYVNN